MKQRNKNTTSLLSSFALAALVGVTAAAAWSYWGTGAPPAPNIPPAALSPDPPSISVSELSAYDKYVATARKKGWTPVDPIEKLSSTISKFGQVVDAKDMKRSNEFLKMLVQEFHYVINVLVSTPGAQFDLSHLLGDALEMLKIAYFKSTKDLLWSGHSVVTRRDVDRRGVDVQALLAVLEQTLLGLRRAPAAGNIVFDVTRPDLNGVSPLMQAVKFRLYPMISWLLSNGCNFLQDSSLREAVLNGDAMAVSMLLSSAGPASLGAGAEAAVRGARALAAELSLPRVEALLTAALAGSGAAPPALASRNDFLRASDHCVDLASNASTAVGSFRVEVPCPAGEEAAFDVRRRCAIPVRELLTEDGRADTVHTGYELLTLDGFRDQFVLRNQPVVLRGMLPAAASAQWTAERLAAHSPQRELQVGQIPYEPLFEESKGRRAMKIGDFVELSGRYTQDARGYSGAASIDAFGGLATAVADRPPLPAYTFDNQVLGSHAHVAAFSRLFGPGDQRSAAEKRAQRQLERSVQKLVSAISSPSKNETGDAKSAVHTTGQFFMGPVFSGAPFHHHGPAVNVLARGRKLWQLLPPGRDLYSRLHPLAWADGLRRASASQDAVEIGKYYPYFTDGAPCSIIQEEGDVLFVPRHWSHQILNLAEQNLGFAIEIH